MKKIFTLLSLAAATMAANADNIVWGYYDGSNLDELNTVGMSAATTYDVMMKVSGDGVLCGGVIEALNLPVASKTNMQDISVWVADANKNIISSTAVEKTDLSNGSYTMIALDEAVTIPAEGVYVGATYTITKATATADKYPVYCYSGAKDVAGGLLLKEGEAWKDYTDQFGAYAMQLSLANVNLSAASACFEPVVNIQTTPGKEYEFNATVVSYSSEEVANVEYVIELDGVQETRTADVVVAPGIGKKGKFAFTLTGPEALGNYTLKMNITKVNGVANDQADVVTESEVSNVDRVAIRHSVVEEFTGTTCGYCPRGIKGMDNMKKAFGDRFVGVAIHQYDSGDPMYCKNYPSLGFSGAPSCKIDRGSVIDPFYGSSNSVLDDFEQKNAVPAKVDIELEATWAEGTDFESDSIYVDLSAKIYALEADTYTIDFVVTADSLQGSTTAWKQHNYYNTANASQNPGLEEFCKNGEYGKSSFFWAFDDVLLASSYKGTKNQADALGEMEEGQEVAASYSVLLPTKAKILDVVKTSLDKVFGIVIVCDKKKKVANAIRVNVVAKDGTQGINNVVADKVAAPAGRYTLDGKQAAEGQKGITIVRMSDGTVRKELR